MLFYEDTRSVQGLLSFVPPLLLHQKNHYLQLLSPDASAHYITKVSLTQAKTPSMSVTYEMSGVRNK